MGNVHQVFISFELVDSANILYFSRVFELSHQAYEVMVSKQLGFVWNDWFNHPTWTVPIKHTEAEYILPLRGGQYYEILSSVKQVGDTSFIIEHRFLQNQTVYCNVKTVHVFCDRLSGTKIPIPFDLKAKFEALAKQTPQNPVHHLPYP